MLFDDFENENFKPIVIPVNTWKEMLNNPQIFNQKMLLVLKTIYEFEDHAATCKELTNLLHNKDGCDFVSIVTSTGRKIKKFTNKEPLYFQNKEVLFPWLFTGRYIYNDAYYEWKIRKNLKIALKELYPELKIRYQHNNGEFPIIINKKDSYNLVKDLKEIYEKYPIEKEKPFKENPFAVKMRTEIKRDFEDFVFDNVDNRLNYIIDTHTGKGKWTNYPWIGIRNSSVTTSFQNGIYIDIKLDLNNKEKGLDIFIIQGLDDSSFEEKDMKIIFNELVKVMKSPPGFYIYDNKGFVLISKSYNINTLDEKTLENDLKILLEVYEEVIPLYNKISKITLSSNFKEFIQEYPIEKEKSLKNNQFAKRIRNKFTIDLQDILSNLVDKSEYECKFFFGENEWEEYPWVGIRNKEVSTTFQDGLFIIYYLDYHINQIYLSINQGLKKFSESNKNILINRANELSNKLSFIPDGFIIDNDTPKYYSDETSVLSKCYNVNSLDETILIKDLKNILNIYQEIIPEYQKLTQTGNKEIENINNTIISKEDNSFKIWKISLDEINNVDIWQDFKEKEYVTINDGLNKYAINFQDFKSEEEIKEKIEEIKEYTEHNENIESSNIWAFIHEMNINDIVVVTYGTDDYLGIGKIISDYIPSIKSNNNTNELKHIRKVNWIVTENIQVSKSFFTKDTFNLISPKEWNIILGAYAKVNTEYRNKLLHFLYDSYEKEYLNTKEGQDHKNRYITEKNKINDTYRRLIQNKNDGQNISDGIWANLISPDDSLFKFLNNSKNFFKNNYNLSDTELENVANYYFDTLGKLVDNDNINNQKMIFNQFSENKLSNGIQTGLFTPVLYFLDSNYYIINQKTIDTLNLLSLFFDDSIKITSTLNEYVDNNIKIHNFLDKISQVIPELKDYNCFDEFCHYLCDFNLGYYAINRAIPLLSSDTGQITINKNNENKIYKLNLNKDNLKTNMVIQKSTIYQICAMLNAGKNIILEGIPGTGKTKIALDIAKSSVKNNFFDGYITTTATSDWTTVNLIGGLMPDKEGLLKFKEGTFLKAIRENKLLIIDEINRADIDKSFGQLFTVLSGQPVELNYTIDNIPIKIEPTNNYKSYYDSDTKTYYMGSNWKIIATMNIYDKDSLFDFSYAFMRRFAFITINTPAEEQYEKLIRKWASELDSKYTEKIIEIEKYIESTNNHKIGPAIYKDIIEFIKFRLSFDDIEYIIEEAVISLILPQYEGSNQNQLKEIRKYFVNDLKLNDTLITNKIEEIYGINL